MAALAIPLPFMLACLLLCTLICAVCRTLGPHESSDKDPSKLTSEWSSQACSLGGNVSGRRAA